MDLISQFPQEICDNLFKYLRIKDLLNVSLVSKRWYNAIENSSIFYKRVVIRFNWKNCASKDIKWLIRSHRSYQNISMDFFRFPSSYIASIENNFRPVLKKFSKTIVSIKTTHDIHRIGEFPKLRTIVMNQHNLNREFVLYSKGFLFNPKLIEILILDKYLYKRCNKYLISSLKEMPNLKVLKLKNISFSDTTQFDFKLTEFCLSNGDADTDDKLMEFVYSQRFKLEVLQVLVRNNNDLVTIMSDFPKLHTLWVGIMDDSPDIFTLPVNERIKILRFGFYGKSSETMRLISHLPNLKVFYMEDVDTDLVNMLLSSSLTLEVRYWTYYDFYLLNEHQKQSMCVHPTIKFIEVPYSKRVKFF